MKILSEHDLIIPEYSIPYLVNGDASHLTEEEIAEIDKFFGNQLGIPVISNISEPYFSYKPAFGKAGTSCDCKVIMLTVLVLVQVLCLQSCTMKPKKLCSPTKCILHRQRPQKQQPNLSLSCIRKGNSRHPV